MSRPRFPKEKFLLVVLLLLNNALVIPISIFSQELAVQLMQIIRKPGIYGNMGQNRPNTAKGCSTEISFSDEYVWSCDLVLLQSLDVHRKY